MVRFGGFYRNFRFYPGKWFERGDIKYLILDLLKEKSMHGYEIMKELETRFFGFYAPSAGTVYPTLQLLDELGLVRSREDGGKKVYEITEEGLAELKKEREKVNNIWDMTEGWEFCGMPDLNDLFEELGDLKKFVRMRMRARGLTPEKLKKIRKIITTAKDEILEVLKA